MDDLIDLLVYMTVVTAMFTVCGIGADYILPHIKPLERWICTLPIMVDEEDET